MELLIERLTESPVIPSSQTIDLASEPCMWVMGAPRADDTRERKPPRFAGLMDVGLAPFVLLGRDGVEWAVGMVSSSPPPRAMVSAHHVHHARRGPTLASTRSHGAEPLHARHAWYAALQLSGSAMPSESDSWSA